MPGDHRGMPGDHRGMPGDHRGDRRADLRAVVAHHAIQQKPDQNALACFANQHHAHHVTAHELLEPLFWERERLLRRQNPGQHRPARHLLPHLLPHLHHRSPPHRLLLLHHLHLHHLRHRSRSSRHLPLRLHHPRPRHHRHHRRKTR